MKKTAGICLCMAMVVCGSVYAFAMQSFSAINNSDVISKISDDELLIDIASDMIDASSEYYYINNIRVENKTVSFENNRYNVDYVIEMDELLKADEAMELPLMQGIAEALDLESGMTVTEFKDAIVSKDLENEISEDKNSYHNAPDRDELTSARKELVDFVSDIENEYIGRTYPAAIILRACFDPDGNFIKLQTQDFFGEFTDDLSIAMPESYKKIKEKGKNYKSWLS